MAALVTLKGREGVLHVCPTQALDDKVAAELRAMLQQIPLAVPIILELADDVTWTSAEIGLVRSFTEVAASTGHVLAITAGQDLCIQLSGVGLDPTIVLSPSPEECERRLTAHDVYSWRAS